MDVLFPALSALFALSIAANAFLYLANKKLKKSPPPQQTYDATALLHDLTAGQALVHVTRINPSDVFLRSPRAER